jgi:hypothetical protein
MTLPVIPGPFSGLQQAGQVIGESLAKKRAMSIEDETRARAALLTLGQLGILNSDALAGGNYAGTFGAANIPQPTPEQVAPDLDALKGRRLKEILQTAKPGGMLESFILGLPDNALISEKELKEYVAQFALREAKGSDAITRALAGTQEKEVAEKAETVAAKELDVKSGALDAEQVGNQVRSQIRQSVLKRLPKDPEFARLADYAEIGALGVLVSHIQARHGNLTMEKQASIERMKGLMQVSDLASKEFDRRVRQWNAERDDLHDPVKLSLLKPGYDRMKPDEKDAVQTELLAQHERQNPQPTFDGVLEEHLGARGVGMAEYQAAMRDMLQLSKEADATEGTAAVGTPAGVAPARADRVAKAVQAIKEGQKKADGTPYTLADVEASNMLNAGEKKKVRELLEGNKP